jgi:hypothetical protein
MTDDKLPTSPAGFGPAAEKLADTVRHVVDLVAGPNRIRAKAQAQADAEVILAEGRDRVSEIEERAVKRLRKRESRRQRNIERIGEKSIEMLPPPDQVSDTPVREDWTTRFFEECQDISDEQIQRIWARILAGEVARPGSFGPRTLSVVRDLTKEDADLFTVLCRFTWIVPDLGFVPVVHEMGASWTLKFGISIGTLQHLVTLGLVSFDFPTTYSTVFDVCEIEPSYFGSTHKLKAEPSRVFPIGHVVFSSAGLELTRISGAKKDDEIRKGTLAQWSRMGWNETPPDG